MDAAAIRKALETKAGLSRRVREWRVEVGSDASGEAAIWVWVQLDEANISSEEREAIRERVREVAEAAANESPAPWAYVRVLERAQEPTS